MSARRLVTVGAAGLAALIAVGSIALVADEADAQRRVRPGARNGRIFVLPQAVDSDAELDGPTLDALVRTAQGHVTRGENGSWRVYFLAFLNRAVAAPQVFAVFHRLPIQAGAEPASVTALNLGDPQQRVLATSVSLSGAEGYEAGQRVRMQLARMVGGREVVYARTEIELR